MLHTVRWCFAEDNQAPRQRIELLLTLVSERPFCGFQALAPEAYSVLRYPAVTGYQRGPIAATCKCLKMLGVPGGIRTPVTAVKEQNRYDFTTTWKRWAACKSLKDGGRKSRPVPQPVPRGKLISSARRITVRANA